MITQSAYLYRRVKRLEQQHRALFRRDRGLLGPHFLEIIERVNLLQARRDLNAWATGRVRPSLTNTIWRSKRDGGPYRLS